MSPEPKLKFLNLNLTCSFWGLVNAVCSGLQLQRTRNESRHEARKFPNRAYIIDEVLWTTHQVWGGDMNGNNFIIMSFSKENDDRHFRSFVNKSY